MMIRSIVLLFIVSVCIGQSVNDTSVNQTSVADVPPTPVYDCTVNNPSCNGNGVCQYDGTCRCYNGYFGILNTNRGGIGDDCPYSTLDLPGVYDEYIRGTLIFQGVIYAILLVLTLYRLFIQYFISRNDKNTSVLAVWWILFLILLHAIFGGLQSVDYWGMMGKISFKALFVIYVLQDPLFVLIFSSLLFHWAELYYSSVRKMKTESMLKKIKPDYQSNLTIEEVILKIQFLSKFRFMYMGLAVLSFAFFIGACVSSLTGRDMHRADVYGYFYNVAMIVIWVLIGVGYIVYGVRLIQIVPDGLTTRIKSTMISMAIFAAASIAYSASSYSFNLQVPGVSAINNVYVMSTLRWISAFCALNVCMPVWEYHKWFNPKLIKSLRSTSIGASHPSGTESLESKMELGTVTM